MRIDFSTLCESGSPVGSVLEIESSARDFGRGVARSGTLTVDVEAVSDGD